jgi:hypothetical protein
LILLSQIQERKNASPQEKAKYERQQEELTRKKQQDVKLQSVKLPGEKEE